MEKPIPGAVRIYTENRAIAVVATSFAHAVKCRAEKGDGAVRIGNQFGTIFQIKTDGSGYQVLYSFISFTDLNVLYPLGPLTISNAVLYGTTVVGGENDAGAVFVLHTFRLRVPSPSSWWKRVLPSKLVMTSRRSRRARRNRKEEGRAVTFICEEPWISITATKELCQRAIRRTPAGSG